MLQLSLITHQTNEAGEKYHGLKKYSKTGTNRTRNHCSTSTTTADNSIMEQLEESLFLKRQRKIIPSDTQGSWGAVLLVLLHPWNGHR
jgi:hypothetical protein